MDRCYVYLQCLLTFGKKYFDTKVSGQILESVNHSHCNFCTNYIKFLTFNSIHESSKGKMKWAIGVYKYWHTLRAEIHCARNTATWTQNNKPILLIHEVAKCIPDLKHDVCDFIIEIHKENGAQFPSSSLYDLLQGLSMYLEDETRQNN